VTPIPAFAVAILLAAGGAADPADAADPAAGEATIRVEGDSMSYAGAITPEAVARAREALSRAPQVHELAIDSVGGDVEAGMNLGELVLERGLDVRVPEVCVSSCANYVFLAGVRKTIAPGALVLWHGSLIQKGLGRDIDMAPLEKQAGRPLTWLERWRIHRTMASWLRRTKRRQARFYSRLGIDQRITVIGQMQGCECDWTLSVADMEAFGVQGVSAPDGYGAPGYGRWQGRWKLVALQDRQALAAGAGN
jgi:hypothetical protein